VIGSHFRAASSSSNIHSTRSKQCAQPCLPVKTRARTATIQIESSYPGLGKSVARKVRFCEQVQSGDAARLRELMPHRIADDAQAEIRDNLFAKAANRINLAK